jgi:hypothetical protein
MSVSEREQAGACSSRATNDDHDSCEATESIEDAGRDIVILQEREQDVCIIWEGTGK